MGNKLQGWWRWWQDVGIGNGNWRKTLEEDKDKIFFLGLWRNVKKTLNNGDKEKGTLGNEGTRDQGMLRRWQEC